jgi:hypothetical protein
MSLTVPLDTVATLQTLYDNSSISDIELIFNGKKYNLIMTLLKKYVPILYDQVRLSTVESTNLILSNNSSSSYNTENTIVNIKSVLNKAFAAKKVSNINNQSITEKVVTNIFMHIYGYPLELTMDNVDMYHEFAHTYGMVELSIFSKKYIFANCEIEEIIKRYDNAIKNKSNVVKIYARLFELHIMYFPDSSIIDFISKFTQDELHDFLKSDTVLCDEDLIFKIINKWLYIHTSYPRPELLYAMINLKNISGNLLVTTVSKCLCPSLQKYYIDALEYKICNPVMNNVVSKNIPKTFFALGMTNRVYEGYRKITKNEINMISFKKILINYLRQHNAIYIISELITESNILIDENNILTIDTIELCIRQSLCSIFTMAKITHFNLDGNIIPVIKGGTKSKNMIYIKIDYY